MPEVLNKKTITLLGKIREKSRHTTHEVYLEEVESVLAQHGGQYFDKGEESLVFIPPFSPAELQKEPVLVSVHHAGETPLAEMKRSFYLVRILRTLFPHNFPSIKTAFGGIHPSIKLYLSGTVRKRIFGNQSTKVAFPFSQAEDILFKKLKLPIKKFDSYERNYIRTADGGEYYVDIPSVMHMPEHHALTWDRELILDYMLDQKYSKQDIARVLKSIGRIMTLMKEM